MDQAPIAALVCAVLQPAFYLKNGVTEACNEAAETLGVRPGMSVEQLLDPMPEFPDENVFEIRAMLLGTVCTLRCSRVGADGIFLTLESKERDALPPVLRGIRYVEQDLSVAIELVAHQIEPVCDFPKEHMSLARRSLYRLERIALRLEWYYRLSGETPKLTMHSKDIPIMFRSLCERADDLLRSQGKRVEWVAPGIEHMIARIDSDLTEMMFWELISMFASISGHCTLKAALVFPDEDTLRLTVSIPDHCSPLPGQTESMLRVFSEDPVTWAQESFDLGIVSMAAKLHGGSLLVSTAENGAVSAVLTLKMTHTFEMTLRSPVPLLEHGMDQGLVMLSELLPLSDYDLRDL